jgi:hypothetical protein
VTEKQETPKNIGEALAAVMTEVGYVQKKKQGGRGIHYTFASERDFIKAVRPNFVKLGIVVYPSEISDLRLDTYTTANQKVMNRTVTVVIYTFLHAPSGTSIDVQVTGEGADVGDKGVNKALTGAYKYALRQALLIETGDDPDQDPSEGPGAVGKKPTTEGNGKGPQDEKKAYWDGLSPVEREIYQSLSNLVPRLVENCNRYDNRFAVQGAIESLFPNLKDNDYPSGKTWDDGQTRVAIYRTVKAYAQHRSAGKDKDAARRDAFETAKNI